MRPCQEPLEKDQRSAFDDVQQYGHKVQVP